MISTQTDGALSTGSIGAPWAAPVDGPSPSTGASPADGTSSAPADSGSPTPTVTVTATPTSGYATTLDSCTPAGCATSQVVALDGGSLDVIVGGFALVLLVLVATFVLLAGRRS